MGPAEGAKRWWRETIDGADCANCPFAVDGKPAHPPVFGIGPEDPWWVALGEGPGFQEVKIGFPMIGPTGQLLDRAFKETGIDRSRLLIANAALCLPQGSSKDEKARAQAAHACSGRLRNTLKQFPGKPVLAMGNVAAKTMVGAHTDLSITKISGSHFEVDVDGTGPRSVILTVHPAAILRGSDGGKDRKGDKGSEKTGGHVADLAFWPLKWDILKTKNLADGKDIRLRMRLGHELATEITDRKRANALMAAILKEAKQAKQIGIDYETYVDDFDRNSALQAVLAKIKLVGLAVNDRAICVLWDLLDAVTLRAYRAMIADATITKVYHNGGVYDRTIERNRWYRFKQAGPWEDTLLAQHAAWPGSPKKLQQVACQYRAISPWKSEYREHGEDDLKAEATYCASDALSCNKTWAPAMFWVKKNGVEKVYDVDKVKAGVAALMHEKGYFVDRDVNAEAGRRLTAVMDSSNESLMARFGEIRERVLDKLAAEQAKTSRKADPSSYQDRVVTRRADLDKLIAKGKFEFSPSNPNHAVAFLKAAGVPLWKPTKSGLKTSTAGDILEEFGDHPEVNRLLLLRSNEQLHETFIERMFEWKWNEGKKTYLPPFVQDDGRCHPLWSPTQISGRFSSTKPASSNWSMGDETNADPTKRLPNVRRQLVAAIGNIIVAFDAAQLEARTMAVQSGDPFLCKIFADGLDIHYEMAKLIFPQIELLDKDDPLYGDLRDQTKRFEYGALYGGSDVTVHKALASNKPELAGPRGFRIVQAGIAKLRAAVGGVAAWQNRLMAETSRFPYTLRSYLHGRMRVYPLGNPPATEIANNPNQYMGADVVDAGLCRFMPMLDKYGGTAYPILHQHDAVYVECREDDGLSVARDMKAAFPMSVRAVNGQEIEFPIDLKMGYAYHVEPSDSMKALHPQLVWNAGRPGLKKVKGVS